jgi:hypothetical protein
MKDAVSPNRRGVGRITSDNICKVVGSALHDDGEPRGIELTVVKQGGLYELVAKATIDRVETMDARQMISYLNSKYPGRSVKWSVKPGDEFAMSKLRELA